jgi:hypothetical protein
MEGEKSTPRAIYALLAAKNVVALKYLVARKT